MQHPKDLTVFKDRYITTNRLAVRLLQDGEPYASLSTNVEEADLEPNEFVVKNYSENTGLDDLSLYNDMFEDTGKVVLVGFAVCPVWRLSPSANEM